MAKAKPAKTPEPTAPMPAVGDAIKVLLGTETVPAKATVEKLFPSGSIGIRVGTAGYIIPLWRVVAPEKKGGAK